MTDKANLKDFISDLSKCSMINSQNLEVTVMRIVSLSSFVCFTWFGWQNLSMFKIMPLGLSAWFILSSEWLSSQFWNHVLLTEMILEQIHLTSGKDTNFYFIMVPSPSLHRCMIYPLVCTTHTDLFQKPEKVWMWHQTGFYFQSLFQSLDLMLVQVTLNQTFAYGVLWRWFLDSAVWGRNCDNSCALQRNLKLMLWHSFNLFQGIFK